MPKLDRSTHADAPPTNGARPPETGAARDAYAVTRAIKHPFLELFSPHLRSKVASWFYLSVRAARRGPPLSPEDLLNLVWKRSAKCARDAYHWSGPESSYWVSTEESRVALAEAAANQPDTALDYASAVLEWEAVPWHEKPTWLERRKEAMAEQREEEPPTSKQIAFLRYLGQCGPRPRSKAEASRQIDTALAVKKNPSEEPWR